MISWFRTSFGNEEIKKIKESILNEHISQGAITKELELEIGKAIGIPYVVATTSGSVALIMALMALGVGPGDEVIVPNRTWIATAHAVVLVGANVVLAEVRNDIPLLDIEKLKTKITDRTRAIIPVHLNGRADNLSKINEIAKEHSLYVVEDAAQAFLSRNNTGYLGTQSDIGCFSLGVTKLIATGQGGFLVTHSRSVYEKLVKIRWHGTHTNIEPVYCFPGCNYKFNDILASMGLVQLSKAQQKITHINEIYHKYCKGLKDLLFIKMIPSMMDQGEVPLYAEALCDDREAFIVYMKKNDIDIRPFLPNLDTAKYFGCTENFSASEIFGKHGVFLPCGPTQPLKNIDKTIEVIKQFSNKLRSKK